MTIWHWGSWEQTLIFIRWHASITRLSMWQQGPIAELLEQVFSAGIWAKGQAESEWDIWF